MIQGFWKDEARVERVRKLYVESGFSASEIAASVGHGVSRNAIIGLIHRKGWEKSHRKAASPPSLKAPIVRRDRQPGAVNARGNRRPIPVDGQSDEELAAAEAKRAKAQALGKASVAAVEVAANDGCIPLIDRRAFQCAWPMGVPLRPAGQLCCGQPVPSGAGKAVPSYCDQHARQALAAVQPKRKVPTEPSIKRRAA